MWKPIAIITANVAVVMAGIIFWLARDPGQVNADRASAAIEQPADTETTTEAGANAPASSNGATAAGDAANAQAATAPKGFCERDFEQVEAREADVADLQAAGGLVHIFEREARLEDPYGCADFYLAHGLDVNAVDERDDTEPLTGLFYAIQRNDPKMLRFMIAHDADLEKRAGPKDTRAMGYAYYLALKDQRIDRNEIIGILDGALTRQAAAADSS